MSGSLAAFGMRLGLCWECREHHSHLFDGSNPVSVSIAPPTASVLLGNSVALEATVSNSGNTAVSWSVAGIPGGNSAVGMISAAGVFTTPQVLPVAVAVEAAANAQPAVSSSAQLNITSVQQTLPILAEHR